MPHRLLGCKALAAGVFVFLQLFLSLTPFGQTAAHAQGRPGEIVRVWPLEGGAPFGAKAYRVLYRSTGFRGQPVLVTGAIIYPSGGVPAGGRNVIAWAHPTTGVVDRCAPTLLPGFSARIPGLEEMLQNGYAVVATDYEGLGTPGMHPYLIGTSEARAVIDSVRAARQLQDIGATHRFAVWGHSQGGHAALFTAQLVSSYAPELDLVGIAAAAPATYLADLFEADRNTHVGRALSAMTILSWSRLYNLPVSQVVDPRAMPAFRRVAGDCVEDPSDVLTLLQAVKALEPVFFKADPIKRPAWRAIMDRNTPGQVPIRVPVFVAQGTSDDIVPASITRRFVRNLCRRGTPVTYLEMARVSHQQAAIDSRIAALDWMTDRFRGKPVPENCGQLTRPRSTPAASRARPVHRL